jgi:hypothetical protein
MPDSKESSISALQNMDVDNSIAKKDEVRESTMLLTRPL